MTSPDIKELLPRLKADYIDAGYVQPPPNGAMFWAFYRTLNIKDRNVHLLSLFRQAASQEDQSYQSLRELGKYLEFKPHLYIKDISRVFCEAFAGSVTGDTITIAVDSGKPDDFFMTVEMPILMKNRGLQYVQRIMPHPADPDALRGLFHVKAYSSIPDWLCEQRQQWFNASLRRTQRDIALSRLDGSPFNAEKSCAVREMALLGQRLNNTRPFHEDHESVKAFHALWQKGKTWLKQHGL